MHQILGYMIADFGVRLLPARIADRVAVWVARGVFALRPPARIALERNLSRLFPELRAGSHRRLARRAFEHFALSVLDFLRLGNTDRTALGRSVQVRGLRHLEAARAAGRGVIVLSAHLGNWEWGAAFLAASGTRLHVVARAHPNRWVERFFRSRRRARGVDTLVERPVWTRAAGALRRGEWVALLGDRKVHGVRSSVGAWAAALARRTGALVLPGVMVRTAPGRYAACFGAPLTASQCRAGAYRQAMTRFLRRYPSQWLAFETTPAGWG